MGTPANFTVPGTTPPVSGTPVRDLLVDSVTGELVIANGDLVLVGGGPSIAQDCRLTLQTVLGEWFADQTVGVDWFGQILVKNPNLGNVQALLRAALLGVEGVTDVTELSLSYSGQNRTLAISFSVKTDAGLLVQGSASAPA